MKDIQKYKGVFPAFYACYDKNGEVDPAAVRKLAAHLIQKGVKGVYVGGSSGECIYQSVPERKLVLENVMEAAQGKLTVIAHVACNNTRDSQELARHAESLGVDAIASIPPIYFRLPDRAIAQYWNDISAAAPHTDFIIYNIPSFTGIEFNKDNASELLANPNIIGIKHTSKDLYNLERMATDYPDKILINGYDEQFLAALCMGAQATIGTTVNLFYPLFKGVRAAFEARDLDTGKILQQDINWRMENIVKVGLFPATKYGCSLKGTDCGTCRRPFRDITKEQKALIKKTVETPYPDVLKKYV